MIKQTIDNIQAALNVANQLENTELKNLLVDIKLACVNHKEEIVALKEENAALKEQLHDKSTMQYNGAVYYRQLEDGKKDGPFCRVCFDKDGKVIRIRTNNSLMDFNRHCDVCGNSYFDREEPPFQH